MPELAFEAMSLQSKTATNSGVGRYFTFRWLSRDLPPLFRMEPNPLDDTSKSRLLDEAIAQVTPEAHRLAVELLAILHSDAVRFDDPEEQSAHDDFRDLIREMVAEGPEETQWLVQRLARDLTSNKRLFRALHLKIEESRK